MKRVLQVIGLVGVGLVPSQVLADWSGTYVGVSGGLTVGTELRPAGSNVDDLELENGGSLGAFIGTQRQTGNFVLGGEFAYSNVPSAESKQGNSVDFGVYDVKARFGYAFDNALAYTSMGISSVNANEGGADLDGLGANFGIGVDYMISDQIAFGAEYQIRRARDGDSDSIDYDADSVSLRASYKF